MVLPGSFLQLSGKVAGLPSVRRVFQKVKVAGIDQVAGRQKVCPAIHIAGRGQEVADRIAVLAVILGRLDDLRRFLKATFEILEQPVDHPVQDARSLFFEESIAELLVTLGVGDLNIEQQQ